MRTLRIIMAVSILLLALVACGGGEEGGAPVSPTTPTETGPAQGGTTVQVVDIAFKPAELRVRAGATVRWTWEGSLPHTVTGDVGSFDSKTQQKGATFERTFSTPGRIEYYCMVHSSAGGSAQNGVIIVE